MIWNQILWRGRQIFKEKRSEMVGNSSEAQADEERVNRAVARVEVDRCSMELDSQHPLTKTKDEKMSRRETLSMIGLSKLGGRRLRRQNTASVRSDRSSCEMLFVRKKAVEVGRTLGHGASSA